MLHETDHHTSRASWAELSMALKLGHKSTGVAAELLKVMERSVVRDFIAIIVARGIAKCMQHLICS
jgi:hypothetical protein